MLRKPFLSWRLLRGEDECPPPRRSRARAGYLHTESLRPRCWRWPGRRTLVTRSLGAPLRSPAQPAPWLSPAYSYGNILMVEDNGTITPHLGHLQHALAVVVAAALLVPRHHHVGCGGAKAHNHRGGCTYKHTPHKRARASMSDSCTRLGV